MAQRFVARREAVDRIIASSANRTMTTARIFAEALGGMAIQEVPAMYAAKVPTLMSVLNGLDDQDQHILLFGHNPGVTDLVAYLIGYDPDHMAPCTTVRVDLPVESWREVAQGIGMHVWRDQPSGA